MGDVWEVVGGFANGIIVRTGESTDSPSEPQRLIRGARIRELAVSGNRLHFELLVGCGPLQGWASIWYHGRQLLSKASSEHVGHAQMFDWDELDRTERTDARNRARSLPANRFPRIEEYSDDAPRCNIDYGSCTRPSPRQSSLFLDGNLVLSGLKAADILANTEDARKLEIISCCDEILSSDVVNTDYHVNSTDTSPDVEPPAQLYSHVQVLEERSAAAPAEFFDLSPKARDRHTLDINSDAGFDETSAETRAFKDWMSCREPLLRFENSGSGLAWDFPLAKTEKRELLLLHVAAGERGAAIKAAKAASLAAAEAAEAAEAAQVAAMHAALGVDKGATAAAANDAASVAFAAASRAHQEAKTWVSETPRPLRRSAGGTHRISYGCGQPSLNRPSGS